MDETHASLALSVGIKVLFLLAIAASVAHTYQVIMVAKDYQIVEGLYGPDTTDFEAP